MSDEGKEYEQEVVDIRITRKEKLKLEMFLHMSTHYRKDEMEAWKRLSEEKDENGNIKFKNARSNAEFWKKQNEFLEDFLRRIEAL